MEGARAYKSKPPIHGYGMKMCGKFYGCAPKTVGGEAFRRLGVEKKRGTICSICFKPT